MNEWYISIKTRTARHRPSGLVVKFVEDSGTPGVWEGFPVQGQPPDIKGAELAALMREANRRFLAAWKFRPRSRQPFAKISAPRSNRNETPNGI